MSDPLAQAARLTPGTVLRGPMLSEPIRVIAVVPVGESLQIFGEGLKTQRVHQPILSPAQIALLEATPEQEPFDGDARRFRLGVEALRLGLAYEYDPLFSLSIARVDPLPHQLEAVYDYFLKLPRIRFLLADDPGAGKTIMAGLLIKELKIRGLIRRILIVTPANLSFQWQREMKDKFRESFEIIRGDVLRAHYPWLNLPLSVGTGILLSVASELTITIAGRRHKLFKAQLFNARLAHASASGKHQPLWAVEVERLTDQVRANVWAMRVSMAMSLLAAASYLVDSTGAASLLAFVVATALAGYTLFLMFYHGVQTEAIPEDGTAETAAALRDALNRIRLEETVRLRAMLQEATVSPSARLALIASGLPIPDQRQVLPILRLLLRVEEHSEPEPTAVWLTMRDVALRLGEDLLGRKADDVLRKYRRRCSDNAHKFPDTIRLDAGRGWLVEPVFAERFFHLPQATEPTAAQDWPAGTVVEAEAQ